MFNMIPQLFLCHRYRQNMPKQYHHLSPTSTSSTAPRWWLSAPPGRLGSMPGRQCSPPGRCCAACDSRCFASQQVLKTCSFCFWKIKRQGNKSGLWDRHDWIWFIYPRFGSFRWVILYNECLMANGDACGVLVQKMVSFGCTKQGELCNKKSRNHSKYLAGDGCKWPRNHKCKVAKHEDSEASYEWWNCYTTWNHLHCPIRRFWQFLIWGSNFRLCWCHISPRNISEIPELW